MTQDTSDNKKSLEQLARQTERASLFTSTALYNDAEHINRIEAFIYGLTDVLVEKGLVTPEEITASVQRVAHEMQEKKALLDHGVVVRVEDAPEQQDSAVEINCAERIHLCKAVCCQLVFALSTSEIEGGLVKWDLGNPYRIRHEADGYCTHLQKPSMGCGVYHHRPGICRRYSCVNDSRVWLDFEKMVANEAWINTYISQRQAHVIRPDDIPTMEAPPDEKSS